MTKCGKRLVGVLLAMLVLAALSIGALADGEATYTVTVSAGNMDFALLGAPVQTAEYGKTVALGGVEVPEDSPYFFKGFRPAGHDNNVVYASDYYVTEDADFVAAYGLRANLVKYTIRYLDGNGNDLMTDSEPHYGNIGDKIVVRARDIDGYQPQAYQLAKTLVANEAENVFPFVYSEVVVATPVPAAPAPTPVIYEEAGGGEAAGGAEIEPAPAPGGEAGGGEAAGIEGNNVPEGQGPETLPEPEQEQQPEPERQQEPVNINEDETPLDNGPKEIIDLDQEDTPKGEAPEEKEKPAIQQEREQKQTKFYVSVGLLGVALIAIAVMAVLLVKKRSVKP